MPPHDCWPSCPPECLLHDLDGLPAQGFRRAYYPAQRVLFEQNDLCHGRVFLLCTGLISRVLSRGPWPGRLAGSRVLARRHVDVQGLLSCRYVGVVDQRSAVAGSLMPPYRVRALLATAESTLARSLSVASNVGAGECAGAGGVAIAPSGGAIWAGRTEWGDFRAGAFAAGAAGSARGGDAPCRAGWFVGPKASVSRAQRP